MNPIVLSLHVTSIHSRQTRPPRRTTGFQEYGAGDGFVANELKRSGAQASGMVSQAGGVSSPKNESSVEGRENVPVLSTPIAPGKIKVEPRIGLHNNIRPWAALEHAIVCVGWGEEQEEKFWHVRNSWGREWGDRGYAKLLRGKNYAHSEFQAEYVIPDLDRLDREAFGI